MGVASSPSEHSPQCPVVVVLGVAGRAGGRDRERQEIMLLVREGARVHVGANV